MRKPIICGNWKMNKTRDEALQFLFAVNQSLPSKKLVDVVICPPSIILRDLVKRQGDTMRIGAQNMHYTNSGAFTGEISAEMLSSTGIEYVILGHSERRAYYNETNSSVNLKVNSAIVNNIIPIVCVGESLDQRNNNETESFLKEQILSAFEGFQASDFIKICIAYEPIWAIGTGLTASLDVVHHELAFIRRIVFENFGEIASENVRLLYGGSVTKESADELMKDVEIDGLLVGGASLIPDIFISICKSCTQKYK